MGERQDGGTGEVGPGRACENELCSLLPCVPHMSLMPTSPTPSVPRASGCPTPHLCNVCLPHRSPATSEPPAPLPCEGVLSVPPQIPCIPQHRPPLSRPRLLRKHQSLSCQSRSGLYRCPFESHPQSPLPLLLPRSRPRTLHSFHSTFCRASCLQPYFCPSKSWEPLQS